MNKQEGIKMKKLMKGSEQMPRYINADKLKSWWTERYNPRDTVGVNQVIDAIENAPTALVYCQHCGKKNRAYPVGKRDKL